ncbi:MAG: hypothetical protein QG573_364 [Acidobacteriota bacterium]|nr:hypothetical protein [Acidobacteriota bacterium]
MPGDRSDFAAALIERGRRTPERLAFGFGDARLSYGELLDDASRIAAGLAARGLEPRDRIALLLPAGFDFVRGFAAVVLAGGVPYAIPPELAPTTAMARAARGRPRLALALAGHSAALADAQEKALGRTAAHPLPPFPILALEPLAASVRGEVGLPDPVAVDPEDPAVLQLTSGTTGEPRFAILSHRALAAWRRSHGPALFAPGEVLAGWVPPWHVMGLVRFVILPVVCGVEAHLVTPAVRTLGTWLETAARVRATLTSAPDFALRTALRLVGSQALDLSSLRRVFVGGEAVRASTVRAFEARFDLPGILLPAYGLAEATLAVTCARPGEPLAVDAAGNVSCGRPLPGVTLRILDEQGAEQPAGEPGEIHIRSESLFSGYFDSVVDPASVPRGHHGLPAGAELATGDWGRLGPGGELYVIGRRRNLIKHGGATYAPRELEEAAEQVDGVGAAAAITLARPGVEGPVLVVVVEATPALRGQPEDLAHAAALAVRRAVGLLPGEVIVVTPGTLPRTDSTKLRHAELRRRLAAAEISPGSLLAGRVDGWVAG